MRRIALLSLLAATSMIGIAAYYRPRQAPSAKAPAKRGPFTVEQRVAQFGQDVARRLAAEFAQARVHYPPHELAYVAFKDSRQLQVYARSAAGQPWRFVKHYPILAASGNSGPKLKEGDRQVPEGIYKVELLNPNSRFHLSIRLNYPNDFDRRMAQRDDRTRLGGDIMIHGNAVSIGCLAMGDQAAEDLFILVAATGRERTRIVVSPTDFRAGNAAPTQRVPAWTGELYDNLRSELRQFPVKPA